MTASLEGRGVIRIRIIDFEGNGTEPPAEIIEYGFCDLSGEGFDAPWSIGEAMSRLFGVTQPLDPAARAVHHLRPADLEGKAPFDPVALATEAEADGVSAIAAHAWDLYEAKWLAAALPATIRPLCTYKAALRVWPDAPSHSNGALRYWLEDEGLISPDPALCQPAHRAGPDAYITAHILKALLARVTGREMIAWTKLPALLPRCPIGDFRGKPWSEVTAGFLKWMIDKPVEPDLVWNAERELERRSWPA